MKAAENGNVTFPKLNRVQLLKAKLEEIEEEELRETEIKLKELEKIRERRNNLFLKNKKEIEEKICVNKEKSEINRIISREKQRTGKE